MLEGLLAAHRRYDELSAQLSQPDAAADLGRYRALMKEYQVSLQTISKAVKPLILSGLISPGPRGSAINHASAVRERYYAWGFLCSGSAEMTDVTHDFFQLIHRCLARDSYNMLFLDGHIGGMGYVTFRGRGANDTVPP